MCVFKYGAGIIREDGACAIYRLPYSQPIR